jgi:hypothetical protein
VIQQEWRSDWIDLEQRVKSKGLHIIRVRTAMMVQRKCSEQFCWQLEAILHIPYLGNLAATAPEQLRVTALLMKELCGDHVP